MKKLFIWKNTDSVMIGHNGVLLLILFLTVVLSEVER